MISSSTQVRGGILARYRIVSPRSSGCDISAKRSADGGTGRFAMIGVATSPGSTDVARMPFVHSSRLIDSVSAITARLVALYAGPVRGVA